jgi:hypothetical protein
MSGPEKGRNITLDSVPLSSKRSEATKQSGRPYSRRRDCLVASLLAMTVERRALRLGMTLEECVSLRLRQPVQ